MGSLASKGRHTTIHVTQIQETHLEVTGKRLEPQNKQPAKPNSDRYVKCIQGQGQSSITSVSDIQKSNASIKEKKMLGKSSPRKMITRSTEITASEKALLDEARKGKTLLFLLLLVNCLVVVA